jgi:anti-sigma factor RsiW
MHPNQTTINDYVDELLDPRERAEVDEHLGGCVECRQLVADLREIRAAAAGLKDEVREAPVRAWTRLERAIRLEPGLRSTQSAPSSPYESSLRTRRSASWGAWLALAAAVILATVVGLSLRPGRQSGMPSTPGNAGATASGTSIAASPETAQAVEAELRAAEEHYTKAITGLEHITKTEQNALDPGTAATLQKNLAVIDQAINESRAALRTQPASEPAQESLVENFKAKIGLLQDTVALINEMRTGNDAGAARIVSGLKQKGN